MSSKRESRTRARGTPLPVRRALRAVSEDLATWRKLRGLTQQQLADRAGITDRTVRRLEDGDGGVTLETVFRVLRALGNLEQFVQALDPYETDVGRLRADEQLPQRVRPRHVRPADDG